MDTKVTIGNKMNTLRQQIEQDRVSQMNQQHTIKDGENLPDDMPKEAKEALQLAAAAAKIQLAMVERRLATREPALAELEKLNASA